MRKRGIAPHNESATQETVCIFNADKVKEVVGVLRRQTGYVSSGIILIQSRKVAGKSQRRKEQCGQYGDPKTSPVGDRTDESMMPSENVAVDYRSG